MQAPFESDVKSLLYSRGFVAYEPLFESFHCYTKLSSGSSEFHVIYQMRIISESELKGK